MIIEYYNYDIASNDTEIKNCLLDATKYYPNLISVLPQSLRISRAVLGDGFDISCPIDYPFGCSDTISRQKMVEYAIKNGANKLDIVLPTHAICNRKYVKLKEEIQATKDSIGTADISIRYILEYRTFNYETLYKVCKLLFSSGITDVFPSSGFGLDSIYDNLLAGSLIKKKVPSINIINNGNSWTEKQIEDALGNKPYGLRVNSINCLEILYKNGSKNS